MQFLKLLIIGVYYAISPKKIFNTPLLSIFFVSIMTLVMFWADVRSTTWINQSLNDMSPTYDKRNEQGELVDKLIQTSNLDLARYVYQLEINSNGINVKGWNSEIEKALFPKKYLLEQMQLSEQLLIEYPGSRDLLLYIGWINHLLNNTTETKIIENKLMEIDPNDFGVVEFVNRNSLFL